MKNKLFTSFLILTLVVTFSFTSVFAETAQTLTDTETTVEETAGTEDQESTDVATEENTEETVTEETVTEEAVTDETTEAADVTTEEEAEDVTVEETADPVTVKTGADFGLTFVYNNSSKVLDHVFTFRIAAVQSSAENAASVEDTPLPTKKTVTYNRKKSAISFGNIVFDAPGVYAYKVTQDKRGFPFVKYDTSARTVTVVISEDETGALSAEASVSGKTVFTNSFNDVSRVESSYTTIKKTSNVKTSLSGKFKHGKLTQLEPRLDHNFIVWKKMSGVKGYYLYKKTGVNGKWKLLKKFKKNTYLAHWDYKVKNNTYYEYKIVGFKGGHHPAIKKSDNTGTMAAYFMKRPKGIKIKYNKSKKKYVVSWSRNAKADGYRIEICSNNVFVNPTIKFITNNKKTSYAYNLGKDKDGNTYKYVRVMAYKFAKGKCHYSLHRISKTCYKEFVSKVEFVRNSKGKPKEMLAEAGQKMWGWDTTQGATYDGKYVYMNVENRYANSIKVIKMDQANNYEVVKVSKPIKHCHGNDITYNPDTDRLYITYSYFNKKYVAVMNPRTMKYIGRKHINCSYYVSGKHGREAIRNLNCYNEISYDSLSKTYLLKKKESHSMLVLDKNFKVIRYMRIHNKVEITNQCAFCTSEFYLRVQSNYQSNKKNNYVTIMDVYGNSVGKLRLTFGELGKAELENIYLVGDQMWGSVYKKWWDTVAVGKYVIVDKVKRHGKWVFKKKKVTKKKKYKQLRRTSYIFRIKHF